MQAQRIHRRAHRVTTVFFLVIATFAFLVTTRNWWQILSQGGFESNQSGDWLINYSGGFVRRGLFGELLDLFVPETISIVVVLGALQIILLGGLFLVVSLLYLRTDRSPAWLMICLSPAVLLFPAVNIEAAFRKELISLVLLGILALGAKRGLGTGRLTFAVAIYSLAMFSHEASFVVLPGILFLIHCFYTHGARVPKRIWYGLFIGISIIGLSASVWRAGSESQAQAICESWSARGIFECSQGALKSLTMTTQESISFLHSNYMPQYLLYLAVLALALIPLLLVRFLPGYWRISLVALLFLLPMFLIAWDYGRWIYIALTQLSLLALALSTRHQLKEPVKVPLLVALAFVLLWGFAWYETVWREGFALQILQQLAIMPQ